MTEGVKQKFRISKRYTSSIKAADGTLHSFTSELETEVEVDSGAKLVAENDKLFQQVKWLTDRDIETVFNVGV